MGTLKLCRDRQAQNPFFLEGLSVSVYTLEELCYAIESNLFLLDEKWIGTSLFQWLEKELGEADLTAHLKNSYRKSKDVYECAELILSASGFYTVERLRQIDEMLTRMRGKSPMERRKMKADYFLSEKKYRHAAYGYLELLQQENLIYMTEELQGGILHNLGVAYAASVFVSGSGRNVCSSLSEKQIREEPVLLSYAMNYVPGGEVLGNLEPEIILVR